MPSSLYLTLLNGRTVHVTDTWDGAPPTRIGTVDAAGAPDDGEGIESGEYFRDIFASTKAEHLHSYRLSPTGTPPGSGFPTLVNEKTGGTVTNAYNANGTPADLEGDSLLSDEVNHEKPRGWQKVCTWLVFTGTDGEFHWRACNVDGWSSQPPLD